MRSLRPLLAGAAVAGLVLTAGLLAPPYSDASSHREAPLIADDPLADNTDVYAFRDPNDDGSVILVANYIPLSHPDGGPNYNHFGENIRYEIHVKNQTSAGALGSATDDITYRFTFTRVNEDPSTFFNIRLGKENLNTSYTLEKSTDGGRSFQTIIQDGYTPPAHVGPRSIESAVGLGEDYLDLVEDAVINASGGGGETVFVGPRDDPFFVDLGGVFDLGHIRQQFGENERNDALARDAVAGYNAHSLILRVPISTLQKNGMDADDVADDAFLDRDYVIGVWASASRTQVRTLARDGSAPTETGPYIQVSRLGMPLTNEVIIPIGEKDRWNYTTPYSRDEQDFAEYFFNPELALYMGNGMFGENVPGLSDALTVQQNAYPALDLNGNGTPGEVGDGLDFTNGADGAAAVLPLVTSGALDVSGSAFSVMTRPVSGGSPTALLAPGEPRRVDLFPIFYFGVPNLPPYQLATGKGGLVADTDNDGALEFTEGKPFIETFLPITQTPDGGLYGGDMLRLNMAVPTTDRSSAEFKSWARLGLVRAAAIGLTVPAFGTAAQEFIPHLDGFPNGRRLEDDVTTIELQAVAGVVLAAVGLPEDDATAGDYSDLASPQLLRELAFVAGPTKNDIPFLTEFPYVATPFDGYEFVRRHLADAPDANFSTPTGVGVGVPQGFILEQNYPNPTAATSAIQFHVARAGDVRLDVYDVRGRLVETVYDRPTAVGTHTVDWNAGRLASGTYLYRLQIGGETVATRQATVVR
ncbi:DUF4331 family protein [Rubrivirga sp. S365]|uniref:DUF4331 family protein n=1 Tax=Rubrivirga litoralis TaxID=3075598 RepID=A0ABU3BLS0_9BACT|nr:MULTISPECIES: DUF4331 family protein [unclassified Rubrivirga]MDT0630232.1 DUF4331 family protein [Rubrivirga sp. F394]MDT7855743.1 DUF4331 family protein [Rubrivirga sp. S365]